MNRTNGKRTKVKEVGIRNKNRFSKVCCERESCEQKDGEETK